MYDITQTQTPTGRNLHIFTIIIKVILLNVCIIFRNDSPLIFSKLMSFNGSFYSECSNMKFMLESIVIIRLNVHVDMNMILL